MFMKNILITGGAGYIGSHTIRLLISKGIPTKNIIVFDNLIYGNKKFIPLGVHFYKGDLLNKKDLNLVFKKYHIDSVIHFAAYAYVGESMQNPGKYFENNILGGLNLLEEMLKNNVLKIVFSSSCAIYGHPKTRHISEKSQKNPVNPYGESKLMFEKILNWYDKIHNIKSVCLRYFNAGGADFNIGERHNPETHLIPLVVKKSLGKIEELKLFGDDYSTFDGTCIRDYIHVLDLAEAHFFALQYLNKGKSEKFNLGTGEGTSNLEIIRGVEKISGRKISFNTAHRRKGDPDILIANPSRANKILGWKAKRGIMEILDSAYNWELKND